MLTGKHSFTNGKVDNIQDFNWDQDNCQTTSKNWLPDSNGGKFTFVVSSGV